MSAEVRRNILWLAEALLYTPHAVKCVSKAAAAARAHARVTRGAQNCSGNDPPKFVYDLAPEKVDAVCESQSHNKADYSNTRRSVALSSKAVYMYHGGYAASGSLK